jgi:hypothetical protein
VDDCECALCLSSCLIGFHRVFNDVGSVSHRFSLCVIEMCFVAVIVFMGCSMMLAMCFIDCQCFHVVFNDFGYISWFFSVGSMMLALVFIDVHGFPSEMCFVDFIVVQWCWRYFIVFMGCSMIVALFFIDCQCCHVCFNDVGSVLH